MAIMKFTKKPITIEAFRWDGTPEGKRAARDFAGPSLSMDSGEILVVTNHGIAVCAAGDWIIKSPAGEFYPCTDEVMQATYDVVPEPKEAELVAGPLLQELLDYETTKALQEAEAASMPFAEIPKDDEEK